MPRVPARALAGAGLAAKAREQGFTRAELRGAGLTNARGNDYFPPRLMFPLADARGRIVGFQARKLREDEPLHGKYVNSPESELFHKSAMLYGFHLARTAIAKQERAVVVEGNTDVIALRQAGLEPVVASMGTALTERQLRELERLTRRMFLCFDADAAGEDATLRGMELAGAGFDVRVVALPKGRTPPSTRTGSKSGSSSRRAISSPACGWSSSARPIARRRSSGAREVLARFDDSPERQEALRLLADRLGLPRQALGGLAQRPHGVGRTLAGDLSPATAGGCTADRLERDALAACLMHPGLVKPLAELSERGALRRGAAPPASTSFLVDGGEEDAGTRSAAGGARRPCGAREGLDERTGKELLLNLRERRLRRELANAELDRVKELQTALTRVQDAIHGARLSPGRRYNPQLPSRVAQLAEHPAVNRRVVGSSPAAGARFGLRLRQLTPCRPLPSVGDAADDATRERAEQAGRLMVELVERA